MWACVAEFPSLPRSRGEEEAEEAKMAKTPATREPAPAVPLTGGQVRDLTEVLVRHAIHGWELIVSLPQDASFGHLKRALAKRFLEDGHGP